MMGKAEVVGDWMVAIVVNRQIATNGQVTDTYKVSLGQYSDCTQDAAIGAATIKTLNEYQGFMIGLIRCKQIHMPVRVHPGQMVVDRRAVEGILDLMEVARRNNLLGGLLDAAKLQDLGALKAALALDDRDLDTDRMDDGG